MNTNFRRSIETQQIITRLKQATADKPYVTDDEVSDLIGTNGNKMHAYVRTAIRRLLVDEGKLFVRDRGNNRWKLADDTEKASAMADYVPRVHRAANRGLAIAGAVSVDALDNNTKIQFHAVASSLGVLNYLTRTTTIKKLQSAVEKSSQALAVGRVLEVLKN